MVTQAELEEACKAAGYATVQDCVEKENAKLTASK